MRLRRTDDRRTVEALHVLCFPNDESDLDGQLWLLYDDDDNAVGFCSARELEHEPGVVFLSRAGVLPSAQGKGLQRRMINARLQWAREVGAKWAITYTAPKNYPSMVNLLKCGFKLYEHDWAGAEMHYFRREL